MSAEIEKIFLVVCDSCGNRHRNTDCRSIHEARVSAGIAGWGWRSGKPAARTDAHAKMALDWCPDCSEELAVKVRAEAATPG